MPIVDGISFAAVQPISCLIGDKRSDGFTIMVYSRDSGDITIECDGTTYTPITPTAYGTDSGTADPAALYYAEQLITVSSDAFAEYDIDVSQSGNAVTYTQWTKPKPESRHRFCVMTCQDPYFASNGSANDDPLYPTMYPFLESLLDEDGMPFTDTFWDDDLFYIDTAQLLDTGIAGVVSTGIPKTTLKEYDYGLGYAAFFGLFPGDFTTINGGGYKPPNNDAVTANYGLMSSKINLYKRIGFMCQWGNHEFSGGEGNASQIDVPAQINGAFHKNALGKDGAGYTSYQELFGKLQPHETDARNLDTGCNMWSFEYGSFYINSADNVTNNRGITDPTTIFGSNQIDDMKAAITGSSAKFKMHITAYHPRKNGTGTEPTVSTTQSKWWDFAPLEYGRFMTDADGLMSSPQANGALSTLFWVAGDTHRSSVMHYKGTQGVLQENFYGFTAGMANKHSAHGDLVGVQETVTQNEIDIIFSQGGSGFETFLGADNTTKETNQSALVFDVYGDLGRVRVRKFASYWDGRPVDAPFDEWFEWKKGNSPINPDTIGYLIQDTSDE